MKLHRALKLTTFALLYLASISGAQAGNCIIDITSEPLSTGKKYSTVECREKFVQRDKDTNIEMFDDATRLYTRLSVRKGRFYDAEGKLLEAERRYMLVMDHSGNMYAYTSKGDGTRRKHSSATAGDGVAFAGEIKFDRKGRLILVNDRSGHYRPTMNEFFQIINQMAEEHVDFSKANAYSKTAYLVGDTKTIEKVETLFGVRIQPVEDY